MRLYVTDTGRWAGTQKEADRLIKEGQGRVWEQFEVPTDKDGLLSFLDIHRVQAMHGEAKAMAGLPDMVAADHVVDHKTAPEPLAVVEALPSRAGVLKAIDAATPTDVANYVDAICDRLLVFKGAIPEWLAAQKRRA